MGWGESRGRPTTARRAACALLATLALAPLPAVAQQVQGSARMESEILVPATVQNDADMDFGDIVPGTSNGTVVMLPSPTATCAANAGIIRTGACRAARFDGQLAFLSTLQITKPVGNQISLVGPAGATMRLHDFTFAKGTPLMLGGTLTDPQYFVIGGSYIVYVGATLDVLRTQRPGIYNGSFTLTFDYN